MHNGAGVSGTFPGQIAWCHQHLGLNSHALSAVVMFETMQSYRIHSGTAELRLVAIVKCVSYHAC